MMNKRFATVLLLVMFVLCIAPRSAFAQTEPAYIVSTTQPIATELRAAVNAWLAVSPPSTAIYYGVTYTQPIGMDDTYVSIVGLNITTPDEPWSLTKDDGTTNVIWLGTVKVLADGSVNLLTPTQSELTRNRGEMASLTIMPALIPLPSGGGAYVRFPWEPAKAVKWSTNGLHGADYSLSGGWRAIDLLSGTDMGSGAAKDSVYASDTGDVDWVCDDDTTVAITTSGSYDPFLYAHLLNNANLEIGHTFTSGGLIGTLKHGSFVDSCGTAVQTAEHWHLHWGFEMDSNASFQAEGCILNSSAGIGVGGVAVAIGEKFTCGNTIIKPGGYLTHYGNIPGSDDVGAGDSPSFFDYLLIGFKGIFDALFTNNLPAHQSVVTFTAPILTSIKIVFRIAQILLHGNFNLYPAAKMILATISFDLAIGTLFVVATILRIIKGTPFIP